jgi:conjugal transfer pilin signal peptidase TrbI
VAIVITDEHFRQIPSWIVLNSARLKRAAIWLVFAHVVLGALYLLSFSHQLVVNRSESLPDYLYHASPSIMLEKGGLVAFYPPLSPLVKAHFGDNPVIFVKYVLGVEGDFVWRTAGGTVLVNGVVVGKIKKRSMRNELLDPGPLGRIPKGCYYAGSRYQHGFDSRYASIGFICGAQIYGGAQRLI